MSSILDTDKTNLNLIFPPLLSNIFNSMAVLNANCSTGSTKHVTCDKTLEIPTSNKLNSNSSGLSSSSSPSSLSFLTTTSTTSTATTSANLFDITLFNNPLILDKKQIPSPFDLFQQLGLKSNPDIGLNQSEHNDQSNFKSIRNMSQSSLKSINSSNWTEEQNEALPLLVNKPKQINSDFIPTNNHHLNLQNNRRRRTKVTDARLNSLGRCRGFNMSQNYPTSMIDSSNNKFLNSNFDALNLITKNRSNNSNFNKCKLFSTPEWLLKKNSISMKKLNNTNGNNFITNITDNNNNNNDGYLDNSNLNILNLSAMDPLQYQSLFVNNYTSNNSSNNSSPSPVSTQSKDFIDKNLNLNKTTSKFATNCEPLNLWKSKTHETQNSKNNTCAYNGDSLYFKNVISQNLMQNACNHQANAKNITPTSLDHNHLFKNDNNDDNNNNATTSTAATSNNTITVNSSNNSNITNCLYSSEFLPDYLKSCLKFNFLNYNTQTYMKSTLENFNDSEKWEQYYKKFFNSLQKQNSNCQNLNQSENEIFNLSNKNYLNSNLHETFEFVISSSSSLSSSSNELKNTKTCCFHQPNNSNLSDFMTKTNSMNKSIINKHGNRVDKIMNSNILHKFNDDQLANLSTNQLYPNSYHFNCKHHHHNNHHQLNNQRSQIQQQPNKNCLTHYFDKIPLKIPTIINSDSSMFQVRQNKNLNSNKLISSGLISDRSSEMMYKANEISLKNNVHNANNQEESSFNYELQMVSFF